LTKPTEGKERKKKYCKRQGKHCGRIRDQRRKRNKKVQEKLAPACVLKDHNSEVQGKKERMGEN